MSFLFNQFKLLTSFMIMLSAPTLLFGMDREMGEFNSSLSRLETAVQGLTESIDECEEKSRELSQQVDQAVVVFGESEKLLEEALKNPKFLEKLRKTNS